MTVSSRLKMSAAQTGKTGELCSSWKGGKGRYLKKRVLQRDAYTCTECGLSSPLIMEVDHIKSRKRFPELAFNLDNLRTLCPNCHRYKTIIENDWAWNVWNKGIKYTLEQKATNNTDGLALGRTWARGRQFSTEHRQKLSASHKGKIPWNKGTRGIS